MLKVKEGIGCGIPYFIIVLIMLIMAFVLIGFRQLNEK